jgi:hypothetical protein
MSTTNMDSDDNPERPPPTARRVTLRALAMSALVCRAFIEDWPRDNDDAAKMRGRIIEWLSDHSIEDELEPAERSLIHAPIGEIPPRDKINAMWRSEGLVVLSWALYHSEIPQFDTQCDPKSVTDSLGLLSPKTSIVLANPVVRDHDEILAVFRKLLAVHWRLRELGLNPGPIRLSDLRGEWFELFDYSNVELIDDDLAIGGISISRAPTDAVRTCASIASERHRAINWLLGDEVLYSDVTADT